MKDNILIVDDDPSAIQVMGNILAELGNVKFATNGEDALQLARDCQPDLILLDAEMRGMSGFRVLDQLKADPRTADVPVIFVTSHSEQEFEVCAFEAGAADFIAKPISPILLVARATTQLRMKRMTDQLRSAAASDALTGIANRRKFDEILEQEWLRARRAPEPMALLLIDVDHFKLYNDHYGHPKGDIVLRQVAKSLVGALRRSSDLAARLGGEEFGLLLPQTSRLGAQHVARRLLGDILSLRIPHARSVTAKYLTVSIGVACYDQASSCWVERSADLRVTGEDRRVPFGPADLVLAADKALYVAKRAGRAQVSMLEIDATGTPSVDSIKAAPPGELQLVG